MAKVHDRILELVMLADESDDTLAVSAVNYFRDRSYAAGFALKFTQTTPLTTGTELVFGELVPPPTHIKLTFTFQA